MAGAGLEGEERRESAPGVVRAWGLATRWGGPVALASTALALATWTWETWPDVLVDFGQQLYLAWRISEGQVLYRDLAYYNGPLSLHALALLFTLFGPSLRVVVAANLALLGVLLILLEHVGGVIGGRLARLAGCLAFLTLFAFAQFVGIGNYNYICPYTHESTHGLILALAALAVSWRGGGWYWLTGLLLGLSFLTKAEFFLAGACGVGATVVGWAWADGRPIRSTLLGALPLAAATPVAPAACLLALARRMPAATALKGTLGSWVGSVNTELLNQPFYRWCTGTDDIAGNLELAGWWLLWYGCLVAPGFAAGLLCRRTPFRFRAMACVATSISTVALAWANPLGLELLDAGRPLPAFMTLAALGLSFVIARKRRSGSGTHRHVKRLSLVIFALALMAKMVLNARLYHYGFVLALPATFVTVVALVDWLPGLVRRYGCSGAVIASAGLAILATGVVAHLRVQSVWVAGKTYRVGSGGDAFWADERGRYVRGALRELAARSSPAETLVAFPEGIMINYLSRHVDPSPYTTFHTTELILFGERPILESVRASRPDWVALVHKDTSELGVRFFGQDYARPLGRWVRENYQADVCVGNLPLKDDRFGILLLRRRDQVVPGGK